MALTVVEDLDVKLASGGVARDPGGELEVGAVRSGQFVLWKDVSPGSVSVRIVQSDRKLRSYNVWDSGRGLGDHESQSATSGMLIENEGNAARTSSWIDLILGG